MGKRYAVIALMLLAGIGAWLWPMAEDEDPWAFSIDVPYTDETNPFTEERLRARLARITPLVEEVVGQAIRTDELRITIADGFVAAHRELQEAYPHLLDPTGPDYAFVPLFLTYLNLQEQWASLLGRYVPQAKTIEFYPFMFEAIEPEDLDALIDVILAHELAHVWQDQRFGAFEHEGVEDTTETALARAAVVEGTAEFVSREVAKRLDAVSSFDLVASKRDEQTEKRTGTPTQRAIARWQRWAYGEGLRFVETVHAELGAPATWQRLFGAMPSSVWSIEHPKAWAERPGTPSADLDAWASRLLSILEAHRPRFDSQRKWGHRPLIREDVVERLGSAGLSMVSGPWERLQGGVLFAGTPKRGPLAGTSFLLRAWRFPTDGDALEARAALEGAFARLGPRAWAGKDVEQTLGATRVRVGPNGAVVRSSLVFDDAPLHAHEGAWGLHGHGSMVFEVIGWRDGIGPALLDILDAAVRAVTDGEAIDLAIGGVATAESPYVKLGELRGGSSAGPAPLGAETLAALRDEWIARVLAGNTGERALLQWLQAEPRPPAAWMTAVGPAAGEEELEGVERGRLLLAALLHEDAELRRFALGAIAERRCRLPPWSADVVARIALLTGDEDPWVRAVAVRAAEAMAKQKPLGEARIDALASDASPAVRASLAVSRGVLKTRRRSVLAQLAADSHLAVKRAADAEDPDQGKGTGAFVDRVLEISRRKDGEAPAPREDGPVDPTAAFNVMFEAMLTNSMGKNQEELERRIRRFLVEGDASVRVMALQAIQFMGGARQRFLPELVRAFDVALPRHGASMTLCKGGLDLTPARRHLLAMVAHPWWRVHVLRAIAANELDLPEDVSKQVTDWMGSRDLLLRAASALLVLRLDADDAKPLKVLEGAWAALPSDWRVQALEAVRTHRPGSSAAARLEQRALYSGFREERNVVFDAHRDGTFDEPYVRALLDGMARSSPEVVEEYWSHILDKAWDPGDEELQLIRRLLAEYLRRWRTGGGLPKIASSGLFRSSWPDLGKSKPFVEEVDRCLLDERPSNLKFALAMIRSLAEAEAYPESREVRDAVNRLLSLQDAPADFPRHVEDDFVQVLGEREGVDATAVKAVLRRFAWSGSSDESYIDVEDFIKGHADRMTAAVELVPELLDTGTERSVEAALEVLNIVGPKARHLLPRLRGLSRRALPTWRERLQDAILSIEEDD